MQPINETAGRVGVAMRNARRVCNLPHDDAATLLHVSPEDLLKYERGITQIPADVLLHMFLMSYKMMRVRLFEKRYQRQRRMFCKLKKIVSDAQQ